VNATACPDFVVIGLGAAGSAVALQLARRGAKVVGLDRFTPPHDRGSSHGRTRITRLAVGEGAAYVPLAQRSHELWREFETATGRTLYRRTGALLIGGPAAVASSLHGHSDFFGRTCRLARQFGISHELLDAPALRARFAAFAPRDDERGYFEPDGGVLFPEACVATQLELAARCGAELRFGESMRELRAEAGGVVVRTDRATLHAAHAVLCTGAWLPGQVGEPLVARLRVLRQVLHWFATSAPRPFDAERCPVFIWLHGPTADDTFYGFPMADDVNGVKVATEQLRDTCDPDRVERGIAPEEVAAMFEHHLRGRLPALEPRAVAGATCLYTMAPDGRFVVDRHPRLPNVTIVSPCSGHGFKHSAALGEAVAQRLLGEAGGIDLAPFALTM
jgi:sarcosine oxidase